MPCRKRDRHSQFVSIQRRIARGRALNTRAPVVHTEITCRRGESFLETSSRAFRRWWRAASGGPLRVVSRIELKSSAEGGT